MQDSLSKARSETVFLGLRRRERLTPRPQTIHQSYVLGVPLALTGAPSSSQLCRPVFLLLLFSFGNALDGGRLWAILLVAEGPSQPGSPGKG